MMSIISELFSYGSWRLTTTYLVQDFTNNDMVPEYLCEILDIVK